MGVAVNWPPPDMTSGAEPADIGHYTATDGGIAVLGSPNEQADPTSRRWTGGAYAFDLDCEICPADLDGDGELTIFDFLAFQNAFDAGCA